MSKNFKFGLVITIVVAVVVAFGFGLAKGVRNAHENNGIDTIVVNDTTVVETFDTVYAE